MCVCVCACVRFTCSHYNIYLSCGYSAYVHPFAFRMLFENQLFIEHKRRGESAGRFSDANFEFDSAERESINARVVNAVVIVVDVVVVVVVVLHRTFPNEILRGRSRTLGLPNIIVLLKPRPTKKKKIVYYFYRFCPTRQMYISLLVLRCLSVITYEKIVRKKKLQLQ